MLYKFADMNFFRKLRVAELLLSTLIVFSQWSCNNIDNYEWNTPIENHSWSSNQKINGSFNIEDTSSLYNLSVIVRHTDAYNYNNIWLKVGLQFPNDTLQYKKVNFSLGDDANGWEGVGMGDIWEVKKRLNTQPVKFSKKGIYHFELANIMREDPLQQIISIGFSVEKSAN
jgi:gliding motility-associated lipoprotein GldH